LANYNCQFTAEFENAGDFFFAGKLLMALWAISRDILRGSKNWDISRGHKENLFLSQALDPGLTKSPDPDSMTECE
jgi:hypothetical protein